MTALTLPVEMVREIVSKLTNPSDMLSAASSCKHWMAALAPDLPRASALRISIAGCDCRIGTTDSGDTWLQLCQCEEHGSTTLLSWLLPNVIDGTRSLIIEDDLVSGELVKDESVQTLLAQCANAQLKKVQFSKVNFGAVRPWTLALLGKSDQLEEVIFEECILPNGSSETLLIRAIFPSANFITTIVITHCDQITDKLARNMSRSCPMLETFSVQGCKMVTSFSVLSLIEGSSMRVHSMLTVHVENTKFDSQQLERQMSSPLFADRDSWHLRATAVQMGYEKRAIMAESKRSTCLLIYV